MLPWLSLSGRIMLLKEGTECGKMKSAALLCPSMFKTGSWLTGYIFTYSPAECPILLFLFFIESGFEGKNSCSYAPGRDLLWGWWEEEKERRGRNNCLRATGGFKFHRLYPGAFDSLRSLSLSLSHTHSLTHSPSPFLTHSPSPFLSLRQPPRFRPHHHASGAQ